MAAAKERAERATNLLTVIQDQLKTHRSPEIARWTDEILKLQNLSTDTRTVIGIIGATGAGKSAMINALLDEERILPTSCMRACTAVITEISYNKHESPYRAEVEFISRNQWQEELEILYGDLLDNGKISNFSSDESNEAGIAYSKIKAIYYDMSKEQLATASIDRLMSHGSTRHLGKTKIIEESGAEQFYDELQIYIDSKEKVDLRFNSVKHAADVFEFWPLIKVVRIFLNSPVLRTGVSIVDLPGVHDSNQARAAIAQNYLQHCSRLFIVAPITRAVDDKSAKTLLGQSFKQQLKLDGTFNNVTFVCSKTDDIALSEVQGLSNMASGLKPQYQNFQEQENLRKNLQAEERRLRTSLEVAMQAVQLADDDLESYQTLFLRSTEGQQVYEPVSATVPQKRKRSTSPMSHSENLTLTNPIETDSDEDDYDIDEPSDSNLQSYPRVQKVLTRDDIVAKIADLQNRKAAARKEYSILRQKLDAHFQQGRIYRQEQKASKLLVHQKCITARNEYARKAIRKDFAAGIREIDEELAAESDPEHFDPGKELRDYDEVANSLPVFCVSSRAYQKLCGRLRSERKPWGFEKEDDSEIPQLQAHCKNIGEVAHVASLEGFISKVAVLCNSLKIWATEEDQQRILTNEECVLLENALKAALSEFTQGWLFSSQNVMEIVMNNMEGHIFSKFDKAVAKADEKALETVFTWGKPVDRSGGTNRGLHWSTYQATTRRMGYFPKKDVIYDFNKELSDPFVNHIVHGWESVFMRLNPLAFTETLKKAEIVTAYFRKQVNDIADRYMEAFVVAGNDLVTKQRDVNRQFAPTIAQEMSPIYVTCNTENGKGMFMRMNSNMETGVRSVGQTMFRSCVDLVRKQLLQMIKSVNQELVAKVKNITSWVERDYLQLAIIKGKNAVKEQKMLRETIKNIIDEYQFKDEVVPKEVVPKEEDDEAKDLVKSEDETDEIPPVDLAVDFAIAEADSNPAEPIAETTDALITDMEADEFSDDSASDIEFA